MMQVREHMVVVEEYGVDPEFNEQYEELQKNLVFTPSSTILWYECPTCKRKSATEERLKHHILQKHSEDCSTDITSTAESEIIHQGGEPFKCSICPFACTTNVDLMRHSKKHKGLKPYSCNVCGKTFSQKGNLKPHMLRHTGESPFQCELCPKAFNHKTSYKKHVEEHKNPKGFACRFCVRYSFATQEERNQHELAKHTKEDVDCIICGVILNSSLGLKMHIAQMHPDFPGASEFSAEKKWACQYCKKKFSTKSYLVVHHKIHRGEKPFKCGKCDYCAVSKDSIKKHVERAHGQMKLLGCNLCDKTFIYYSHKKAHMLRHYNLKPFSCHICDRSFLLKRHLTDHIRMHRGEPTFRCEKCDVAYVLPDSLRKHKDLHLSNPIMCHICAKEFWVSGRYNKHMVMHKRDFNVKETPLNKPFKCHLCSKGFKVKHFLNKHLLNGCSDRDDLLLVCTECGERQTSAKTLKKHMKIYHNLKEYSCFVCAEAFKRIKNLIEHIENQHPNDVDKVDTQLMQLVRNKTLHKKAENTFKVKNEDAAEITIIPFIDDQMVAKNVLVIDETAMSTSGIHHIKLEPSEVTYECYSCGEVYATFDELVNHEELEHSTDHQKKTIKIEQDSVNTMTNELFKRHKENVLGLGKTGKIESESMGEEGENGDQFKKQDVEYYSKDSENIEIRDHIDNHIQTEAEELEDEEEIVCYECSMCGKRYATFDDCQMHYNTQHVSSKKAKRAKK